MPTITNVDPSTLDFLPEKVSVVREQYMETIAALMQDGQPRLLTPDTGETLRKMRVNLTRSANDYDVRITMRETRDGSLLVSLDTTPMKIRKTRAPKVVATNGATESSLELPEDEEVEA